MAINASAINVRAINAGDASVSAVLLALVAFDLSGARYESTDYSGSRYPALDLSGARYGAEDRH